MSDPQRFDSILRIAVVVLVVAVLAFGGFFAYTVYRDRVAAENAIPAIRLTKSLQEQVRRNPNDALLRVRLGEALSAAGKTQQAIEQLNAALKIDPQHTGAFIDLGILAVGSKHYDEAKGYFQKVVDLTANTEMANSDQRRESAFYNLGLLALQQKQYDDAIGAFKAALRIRNDASDTYVYLAQALEAIGQNQDAEQAAGYALQFDPSFAQAHYMLGKLHLADGDKVGAAYEVGRAIELAPDAPEPKKLATEMGDPAELFKKATAEADSKPDAAIEDASIAFYLDRSNNIPAAKLAGGLLIKQGDKKGALLIYQRAAEVDATDAAISAAVKELTPKAKSTK